MAALSLIIITILCIVSLACSSSSIPVTASVRGKKYSVDASTVEEFTEKVESLAGLEVGQNSVLFRGKVYHIDNKQYLSSTIIINQQGIESRG